jgi:hypothetical protein
MNNKARSKAKLDRWTGLGNDVGNAHSYMSDVAKNQRFFAVFWALTQE